MNTRQRLENHCVHRHRETLLREVKRFIRRGHDRDHSDGMEWLWRAGMVQEVLLLSLPHTPSARALQPEFLGVERALWLARAWLVQGAWKFARAIVESIEGRKLETPQAKILASALWNSLGEAPRALSLLSSLSNSELSPLEASWRWQFALTRLHSYSVSRNYSEGLQALTHLQNTEPELVSANFHQLVSLEAYFRGNCGGSSEGKALISQHLKSFPELSKTHPRIFTVMNGVSADLHMKDGDLRTAKSLYLKALRSTSKEADVRSPHSELNYLVQLHCHGLGNARLQKRIEQYPALPPELLNRLSKSKSKDDTMPSSPGRILDRALTAPHLILIDLSNGEGVWEGRLRAETPKEILLAALLLQASRNGIAIPLAFTLLWPDEPWNWFQFTERLAKLVQRLRKEHQIAILRTRNTLRALDLKDLSQKVQVVQGPSRLPSLISEVGLSRDKMGVCPPIRSSQVAEFYQLSRRHAINLLQRWCDQGLIERSGAGPASEYRILAFGAAPLSN